MLHIGHPAECRIELLRKEDQAERRADRVVLKSEWVVVVPAVPARVPVVPQLLLHELICPDIDGPLLLVLETNARRRVEPASERIAAEGGDLPPVILVRQPVEEHLEGVVVQGELLGPPDGDELGWKDVGVVLDRGERTSGCEVQ